MALTYTHDCKTLVDEDAAVADEAAGPVRPSMAQTLRQGNGTRPGTCGALEAVDAEYSTHFARVVYAGGVWGGGGDK